MTELRGQYLRNIQAGAIVGGIIELIIKLILISREIKERKMGTPSK